MENLAAFSEKKGEKVETPKEETKPVPKAAESLKMVYEAVISADGSFRADIDYEDKWVSILDSTISFEQLGELAVFVIGLASRIENEIKN